MHGFPRQDPADRIHAGTDFAFNVEPLLVGTVEDVGFETVALNRVLGTGPPSRVRRRRLTVGVGDLTSSLHGDLAWQSRRPAVSACRHRYQENEQYTDWREPLHGSDNTCDTHGRTPRRAGTKRVRNAGAPGPVRGEPTRLTSSSSLVQPPAPVPRSSPATSLRLALAHSSKMQPARSLPPPLSVSSSVAACVCCLLFPGSRSRYFLPVPLRSLGTTIHPRAACPGSLSITAADHARTTSDFSFHVVCVWSAAVMRSLPRRHAARGWIARPRPGPPSRPPLHGPWHGFPADLLAAVAPRAAAVKGASRPTPGGG